MDALPLLGSDIPVLVLSSKHPGMNTQARLAALSKYRSPAYSGRGRALVIFDLHVKMADVGPQRLVVNYDLPRSVEGYAQRVGSAVNANVQGRAGVVVNLIQANGGDVEMLRSIECAYKFKCSEVRFRCVSARRGCSV
jgi:superfamily II DNA/RNA helicase